METLYEFTERKKIELTKFYKENPCINRGNGTLMLDYNIFIENIVHETLQANRTETQVSQPSELYLAFTRIHYEGIYEDNMGLFDNKQKANEHLEKIKQKHGSTGLDYEIKNFTLNE